MGFAGAVPSFVPFDGFPESIANHQRFSELRCYQEVPCPDQPVVDPHKEDSFSRGEVREIDKASIASYWCTKTMRPSSQARIGTSDLPTVAIQNTT
jgi:hypothetical protein